MALKLDILANTREMVSEMKKAGKSVEDVGDELDELAKEGDQAGDKLERTFRDLVRDAKKADTAVEKIGGSNGGFSKAGAASGEFKDEALANFSEVTSSFDGSMSSIADLAQGTLGGVAASIPGIGIAAGVAAAGVGLIGAELQKNEDISKEVKQSLIDDALELGDALDAEAVRSRVRDLLGVEETRKQAQLLADLMGVTVGEAVLALAGDFESAGFKAEEAWKAIGDAGGNVDLALLEGLKTRLKATEDGFIAGRDAARAQEDAVKRMEESNRTQVQRTRDASQERYEAIARQYAKPITGKVKMEVDDSAVRYYRPPMVYVPWRLQTSPSGRQPV